jgi:hypothetical protein
MSKLDQLKALGQAKLASRQIEDSAPPGAASPIRDLTSPATRVAPPPKAPGRVSKDVLPVQAPIIADTPGELPEKPKASPTTSYRDYMKLYMRWWRAKKRLTAVSS